MDDPASGTASARVIDTASAKQRILVVDDDEGIRTVVRWQLCDAGYAVVEADDGASALQVMSREVPLLVVLDLSLRAVGGLAVLEAIRAGCAGTPRDVPVIILSGRNGESDRIGGLDLGADDYLVKPFSPGELAARVRSLLRRAGPTTSAPVLQIGRLVIDVVSREVTVSGERVMLTAKEFDLLAFLAQNPRQVFTRHQLLDSVWQTGEWLGEPTVTEHVHRLRTKLRYASTDSLIRTVRGVGYQFDPTSGPS